MNFQKVNSNPCKRKRGDCVVRALILGLRAKWLPVFDELVTIAREQYAMPNEKEVYAELLRRKGWRKMPMPRFPDNTRYTVAEFAKAHPTGTYVLGVAHHLTVVIDGTLFDTWDCSRKSVGNYWERA